MHPKYKHCVFRFLSRFNIELTQDEKIELAEEVATTIFDSWLNCLENSTEDESRFMIRMISLVKSLDVYHKVITDVAKFVSNDDSPFSCEDVKYDTIEQIETFLFLVKSFDSKSNNHMPKQCEVCQNYAKCLAEWKRKERAVMEAALQEMKVRKCSIQKFIFINPSERLE